MSRNPYPIETIINCCSKYRAGESVNTIVKACGIPRSTVYYWIRQYCDIPETNDITLKKHSISFG